MFVRFLFIPLLHHCPNPILTDSHAFRLGMKPFKELKSVGEAVLSEVRADSHITIDTNFFFFKVGTKAGSVGEEVLDLARGQQVKLVMCVPQVDLDSSISRSSHPRESGPKQYGTWRCENSNDRGT